MGYGIEFDMNFYMTNTGYLVDEENNKHDIAFNFSGDDDVWVFIDGHLVLDLGGAHGRTEGNINFSEQEAFVSAVKDNTDAFAERNHWYVTDEKINKNVTTKQGEPMDSYLSSTRWDFIGLSTDSKPTATSNKVVDGSTFYEVNTSKLYIWVKDQWYEKTSTVLTNLEKQLKW